MSGKASKLVGIELRELRELRKLRELREPTKPQVLSVESSPEPMADAGYGTSSERRAALPYAVTFLHWPTKPEDDPSAVHRASRPEPKQKILLLGEAEHKENFILTIHNDNRRTPFISTLGIDFAIYKRHFQIWDTAGQARFLNITKAYLQNAFAILHFGPTEFLSNFESILRSTPDLVYQHYAVNYETSSRALPAGQIELKTSASIGSLVNLEELTPVFEKALEARAFCATYPAVYRDTITSLLDALRTPPALVLEKPSERSCAVM